MGDLRPPGRATAVDPALVAHVRARAARLGDRPGPEDLATLVRELGGVLGREDAAALTAAVRAEVEGAGPLQPLLEDPEVTDVLVNGPADVWVDRGGALQRVDVDLGDADRVRALAVRLAATGGRRLDDASPVVDARLPDGTRLHAVLAPVASRGALISLRTFRRRAFTLEQLVATGSVAPSVAPVLRALVAHRASFLVSGGTGTGKTTLLGALLSLVPPTERIVCIEDSSELAPDHPHVVGLVARQANVEGSGNVGLTELVRHALRMRPDRIVLGECRGAEVREVLSALNTGHQGGCATVHANAVTDVPARLEALAALAGMSRDAVAAQTASALDAVVHLRREGGRRYVAQIGTVVRQERDLRVEPVLECTPDGRVRGGPSWPAAAARWGLPGGAP